LLGTEFQSTASHDDFGEFSQAVSENLSSLFSPAARNKYSSESSSNSLDPTEAETFDLATELTAESSSTDADFSESPIEATIDEDETSGKESASDHRGPSSEVSPDDTSNELIFGEGLAEEPPESVEGLSSAVSDTLGSLFSDEDNSEFSSEIHKEQTGHSQENIAEGSLSLASDKTDDPSSDDKNVDDETSIGFLEVAEDSSLDSEAPLDAIDGLAEDVSKEMDDLFAESDPLADDNSDNLIGGLPEENSSNEPAEFYNVLGESVEDSDLDISSLDADIDNVETEELALEEESPASSTATLAEIYLEQGLYSQSLAMYKEILQDEPDNSEVQNRISEIESMQSANESDNPNDGADLDSPPQKKLRP
jgi:hypothetical protein